MSITCLLSDTVTDVCCPVCGQGVAILTESSTLTVRAQVKRRVHRTLRGHHDGIQGRVDVHPSQTFAVEQENAAAGNRVCGWYPGGDGAAALAC